MSFDDRASGDSAFIADGAELGLGDLGVVLSNVGLYDSRRTAWLLGLTLMTPSEAADLRSAIAERRRDFERQVAFGLEGHDLDSQLRAREEMERLWRAVLEGLAAIAVSTHPVSRIDIG